MPCQALDDGARDARAQRPTGCLKQRLRTDLERCRLGTASARSFGRTALPEMLDGSTVDAHPGMLRLLEDRSDRRRILRIRQGADRNTDQRGKVVGFPVDGRAAVRTKIGMDLSAARSGAGELLRTSRHGDDIGGVESPDPERCAGSPLAVDAVAGNDQPGRAWKRKRYSAATASSIDHWKGYSLLCATGGRLAHRRLPTMAFASLTAKFGGD